MTLESFIQSRQDERRVPPNMEMRVPQYIAPPPPPGNNSITIIKIRFNILACFSYIQNK